jgi:hypothetical protein
MKKFHAALLMSVFVGAATPAFAHATGFTQPITHILASPFTVTESFKNGVVTYDVINNLLGAQIYEFDVTNVQATFAAADDRSNWLATVGSGCGLGLHADNGFCFFDAGHETAANPINAGESQLFDGSTLAPASDYVIAYNMPGANGLIVSGGTVAAPGVPEPATISLLGAAIGALGLRRRPSARRR